MTFGSFTVTRLTAAILCASIPLAALGADNANSYKISYDGGSFPNIGVKACL